MDKVEQVKALFTDAYLIYLFAFHNSAEMCAPTAHLIALARSEALREVLLGVFGVEKDEIQQIECIVNNAFYDTRDYQDALEIVNSRLAK